MREKSNSYSNTASVHRTRQSDNAATNLIVACRAEKVGLHSTLTHGKPWWFTPSPLLLPVHRFVTVRVIDYTVRLRKLISKRAVGQFFSKVSWSVIRWQNSRRGYKNVDHKIIKNSAVAFSSRKVFPYAHAHRTY